MSSHAQYGNVCATVLDRSFHAALARLTYGLSPAALGAAELHWIVHLAAAPGKRLDLLADTINQIVRLAYYAWISNVSASSTRLLVEQLPQDRRFSGEASKRWPFFLLSQRLPWARLQRAIRCVMRPAATSSRPEGEESAPRSAA